MSRTISSAFIFAAIYDSIYIRQIYEERRKNSLKYNAQKGEK